MKARVLPGCCTIAHLYQLPSNISLQYNSKWYKSKLVRLIKNRKKDGFKLIQAFVTLKSTHPLYRQDSVYKFLLENGFKDIQTLKPTTRHVTEEVHQLTLQLADWKEE